MRARTTTWKGPVIGVVVILAGPVLPGDHLPSGDDRFPAPVIQRLHPPIPGSDRPTRVLADSAGVTLEFARYFIRVVDCRDAVGETIFVFQRSPGMDVSRAGGSTRRATVTIAEDAGHYWGMSGRLLFVDTGCCPNPRGLRIYDVESGARRFGSSWMDRPQRPTLRAGRWLTFHEDIEEPERFKCPESERRRIESEGFVVGFDEQVTLDLRTFQLTRSGKFSCSSRQ